MTQSHADHGHALGHEGASDHDRGHDHPPDPAIATACGRGACESASGSAALVPPAAPVAGGRSFRVPTMDCAAEEAEIRRALDGVAGVRGVRFQLGQRLLTIDADEALIAPALEAIRKAGFDPKPVAPPGAEAGHSASDGHEHEVVSGQLPKLAGALLLAIGAELIGYFAPETLVWRGAGLAVAALAIWLAGFDVYKKGLTALRHGRLNINALMTVAVTGAFAIGQWPEAAMVMALYAIAEAIEARAVDRARNAIKGLLAMAPEEASVRQADGSWVTRPVAEVAVGAVLRVKPGERVPMDGVLRSGQTSINQAPVTGESIPVDKAAGDPVFAGTINESGTFEFEVTAAASNSTLARIIDAVEQAQATRAPTQGFVDRFAAVYTPAVFVIALAVARWCCWSSPARVRW